jgi:hypothetical protein
MFPSGISKPYLEAWLKRTRKQLMASGRLSELVLILSKAGDFTQGEWRTKLQRILNGDEKPGFEIITRVDSALACHVKLRAPGVEELREEDFFA